MFKIVIKLLIFISIVWLLILKFDLVPNLYGLWLSARSFFVVFSANRFYLLIPTLVLVLTLALVKEVFKVPNVATRLFASISLIALGTRYELWRFFSTLNLDDGLNAFLSISLFVLEFLTFINTALFLFLTIFKKKRRSMSIGWAAEQNPSSVVDVLIPTYNEPEEVLRRTLVGCKCMEVPRGFKKKVWVLDDTNRKEIKKLAKDLNCEYISRENNKHAKAGNINNALALTGGEYIAVFDADFIPSKDFLSHTLGFFAESAVAMVQTPQNFYNEDPVSTNLGLQSILNNEQTLFFRHIQPSRDFFNSVICCGTSYIVRREALEKIGGVPVESITEDFFTSLLLQNEKYKIYYLNEALSAGLSPETIGDYVNQRLRWCRGTIQNIYSSHNFFDLPGLSFFQKLFHGAGLLYWFLPIPRLWFFIMPLSFLLFELAPLKATVDGLIVFYLPYYLSSLTVFSWLTEGRRSAFWSDVYETLVCFPMSFTILSTLFKPFGHGFRVTPKGRNRDKLRANWRLIWPQLILIALIVYGIYERVINIQWSTYNVESLGINVAWASYNIVLLYLSILIAIDVPQRKHSRVDIKAYCEINGVVGETIDISEGGLRWKSQFPVRLEKLKEVNVLLRVGENKTLSLRGIIKRVHDSIFSLEFVGIDNVTRDKLIEFIYCEPGRWREITSSEISTFFAFLQSIYRLYSPSFYLFRK